MPLMASGGSKTGREETEAGHKRKSFPGLQGASLWLPGKPAAYNYGLVCLNDGLLWDVVAYCSVLLAYLAFQVLYSHQGSGEEVKCFPKVASSKALA